MAITFLPQNEAALLDLDGAAALPVAALFHSLSDPSRLLILRHLTLGEHRVVDLVTHLGLAQSTVSKHLACLRECGLVQTRASLYGLAVGGELGSLFAAAERVLAVTGDAVELCPTYGTVAARAEGTAR